MNDNVSLGLAHEVEVMLRKVGATRENFWIPISKSEDLARQALNGAVHKTTLNIMVNYNQSCRDMIKAGNYDEIDDNINRNFFPTEIEGKKKRLINFFHFDRDIKSDDVITEMKRRHYRPILIKELLTLGERYPDLQRKFPIVSLELFGYLYGFLYLAGNDSFRRLGYYWRSSVWDDNCRFAAIHE